MTSVPRLSIGLPVYNGEDFLAESLDSLLGQTYEDFELIISDNASTDGTAEICASYAARDSRIRYSRNDRNIGGANNGNRTFRLARGEYFRWAAHDDVCAPTLFERCVAVLDERPEVVLCYTDAVEIDEHGREKGVASAPEFASSEAFDRFRFLSGRRKHKGEAAYGLVRSRILGRTRLLLNYTSSDRVLLCELACHGPFHQLHEPLFYKRHHPGNEYKDWRGRMAWFLPDLQQTGQVTFPNWMEFFDYFATLKRAPIDSRQKALCYSWLVGPWLLQHGKGLVKDVLEGAYLMTRPVELRRAKYRDMQSWL